MPTFITYGLSLTGSSSTVGSSVLLPSSTSGINGIASIQQIGPALLQINYTLPPRMKDPANTNDSLNNANYLLSGGSGEQVVQVTSVTGQADSVYLYLNKPLTLGNWTLTVQNVQTSSGQPLV